MNLPAITLRNTHEHPEGMGAGTLIMAGLTKDRVLDAVRVAVVQHCTENHVLCPVRDDDNPAVSKQVLRIVEICPDYANRLVLRKAL